VKPKMKSPWLVERAHGRSRTEGFGNIITPLHHRVIVLQPLDALARPRCATQTGVAATLAASHLPPVTTPRPSLSAAVLHGVECV
jgi:hypothetical protein